MTASTFGQAPDGTDVSLHEITGGGVTARLISWGARLVDMRLAGYGPSLVLGGADMAAYLGPMRYFGAIVGPVANRIAAGHFEIDGAEVYLERNEKDRTTLHGGSTGTSERNWTVVEAGPSSVSYALEMADGQGGFPGPVHLRASYALDGDGVLTVEIEGTAERPCFLSPAFHGYWVLGGDLGQHRLEIPAESYLPVDDQKIPLGAPRPVAGTPFDYREATPPAPDLDHNFCLAEGRELRHACTLIGTALRLVIESTEPGVQVFTGGSLDTAPHEGHEGQPYGPNAGIAIEPQFWPDTPNHPEYPSSRLEPGETYRQTTRFAVTRL
jgi:aldose 1-epimerase